MQKPAPKVDCDFLEALYLWVSMQKVLEREREEGLTACKWTSQRCFAHRSARGQVIDCEEGSPAAADGPAVVQSLWRRAS